MAPETKAGYARFLRSLSKDELVDWMRILEGIASLTKQHGTRD